MMNIALITYDTHHLKTERLIVDLVMRGYQPKVYALPFKVRAPREILFEHRPRMERGAHSSSISKAYGLSYQSIQSTEEIEGDYDVILIGGAGILPESFVCRYKILNSHPGLIPAARGLDAFKWSIHKGVPLGNTLHIIDEHVDQGTHVKAIKTPIFKSDTLEALAKRHFQMELMMMGLFEKFLNEEDTDRFDLEEKPATKRMPLEIEKEMVQMFPSYLEKYGV